jgi:hypothetical protein
MRLDSARELKHALLPAVEGAADAGVERAEMAVGARPRALVPRVPRFIALGVAPRDREYRLAVRIQRPGLAQSAILDRIVREARGEVDVRVVGRIDKRARASRAARPSLRPDAAPAPWYRNNTRPLLIGASVGHVAITAGTIGAFVRRDRMICVLSNNHVLANEDLARAGDRILQRARYDGGRQPSERIARLRFWVRLRDARANFVDAALAAIDADIPFDASRLRDIRNGADGVLAGVGPEPPGDGEAVFKVGRTTGPTEGRVSAFDLDNLVVGYDRGNLRFDNQVEIESLGPGSFSDGGDSGSLIVNARMEAVGLLFAGSDRGGANGLGLTYANPIQRVLADLKATLLLQTPDRAIIERAHDSGDARTGESRQAGRAQTLRSDRQGRRRRHHARRG